MGHVITWHQIFESSLAELEILRAQMELMRVTSEDSREQSIYVKAMIAYLRQDIESLNKISCLANGTEVEQLIEMRSWIRSDSSGDFDLKEQVFREIPDSILKAEFSFVLATAFYSFQQFKKACDYYIIADRLLEKYGAKKKALRAHAGFIASFSCEFPESRLFSEYNSLSRKAIDLQEYATAGTALLNISREFQRIGATNVALDYAEKAEGIFEEHCFSSREHCLCLIHKAQIYFELDLKQKGLATLERGIASANLEVQSAASILAKKYGIQIKTLSSGKILATWKERRDADDAKDVQMSDHEAKLIELLSMGVCERNALIDLIYGEKVDFESRQNRFKNLISRARKRFPGLIVTTKHGLELNDPSRIRLSRHTEKKECIKELAVSYSSCAFAFFLKQAHLFMCGLSFLI